jgi:hypothetical protein
MNRRTFLAIAGATTLGIGGRFELRAEPESATRSTGELLYNGIQLPPQWPPQLRAPLDLSKPPPYLAAPPAVIPIDIGRQLFVDDFLIEQTTLAREFHKPKEHPANPILRPDKLWEQQGRAPMAMVFSDGVWFDPADHLFKMWYMGGYGGGVCFARSEDGIHWTKPDLDVVKLGTNIVHPGPRDSATVWLDHSATDPKKRFVLFRSHGENKQFGQSVHFSPDGIHWSDRAVRSGSTGDRTTAFYNPFRKIWVYSNRHGWGVPRARRYWETPDLVTGPQWTKIDQPTMWLAADAQDYQREDLQTPCQLYNLDCVAYESLILGLFTIWRGDKNIPPGRPKPNNICVGFSRDGFHFTRPDRSAFIEVSEKPGDWNWGNVQSAGGCCLVVDDELRFYHSGRAGSPGEGKTRDGGGSTGFAILRRDGFASMYSREDAGTLTTRPLRFSGKELFVNARISDGGMFRVDVLDERGQPRPGFSDGEGENAVFNSTKMRVAWKKTRIADLAGQTVRLRFHLARGRLYSFWVSKDDNGRSGGYVAAGGPDLGERDL